MVSRKSPMMTIESGNSVSFSPGQAAVSRAVQRCGFVSHCNLKQTTFTTDHLDSGRHKRERTNIWKWLQLAG